MHKRAEREISRTKGTKRQNKTEDNNTNNTEEAQTDREKRMRRTSGLSVGRRGGRGFLFLRKFLFLVVMFLKALFGSQIKLF
jgi:hypothetical protein